MTHTAIIGCGFIAHVHAQALIELGHSLSVVVDASLPQAEAFAKQWGAQRCGTDFSLALADEIESIHICTPPTLHPAMIKAAILAGKHVICEKPMCLNPLDAKELWLLAQEKGVVGAVNFNVRFHDACQQAKKRISAPDFGRICLIHGAYLQEFHALPADYNWRYKPELAGPMRATTEIGSHWIDLARFWTGQEIEEVSANYGKFTPNRFLCDGILSAEEKGNSASIHVESEDAAVISMRFSNGALGSLLLSEVSHGRNNRVSIEVTGTQQSLWWNSEDPYHLNHSHKGGGVLTHTNPFGGGFPDTFKAFFKEVYQDIAAGRPSAHPTYPTFADGYINAAVCAAIYASATHNSEWVKPSQMI